MSVFRKYAGYYDLLYGEKEYPVEVDYINNLIKRYCPDAQGILELGCGTGRHARLLAERGYRLCCVDMSNEMLEMAREKSRSVNQEGSNVIEFEHGDIRNYRAGRKFDVVIALFHVVSYQSSNEDLLSTFQTAAEHLRDGGVFIFDCWYGPAVLTLKPGIRNKMVENDDLRVERDTTPVLRPDEDIVDVNFDISITDKHSGIKEKFHELHTMRYLFSPQVRYFLQVSGFVVEAAEEWLTGGAPGTDTWNVCYVARK